MAPLDGAAPGTTLAGLDFGKMNDLMVISQTVINGFLMGGVYGLAALGLSLIWGVMKVVNLAHGVFIMLGVYISYWMFTLFGIHPLVSMGVALVVGLGTGLLIYRFLINRLLEAAANDLEMELMTLLFTFALSIIIYGLALVAWGADLRGIPILFPTLSIVGFDLPLSRVTAFVTALVLGGLLYFFLKRTYVGKAIRAVTHSRTASMLSGINPVQIFGVSFSIGIAYAMMAGVIISIITPATPYLGVYYLLKSFTIVVLGGLGNPLGAFAGGLILGLAESATTLFATYLISPAVAFVLLIVILVAKPSGLFGAMR